jgi:pimeloyl-ACP methyl ester carboxylesterase
VRILLAALLLSASTTAFADEDTLVRLDTRPGVSVSIYYMKRDGAPATVVLLPGGAGGIGLKDGVPTSNNFLVRTRDNFTANGFNVAVVGRPSDQELDYEFRISPEHIQDLHQVVSYLKKDTGLPVWLVGTSRGTISATAGAIAFGNEELAGVVLTASVTSSNRTGAVPTQKLATIRIPVLVVHHEKDACVIAKPGEVSLITRGLKNAPLKKQIMVRGGANPQGDRCEALHWHGFIGMERELVDTISRWIKNPTP